MKAFIDKYVNRFISKKLMVFLIACGFVAMEKIAGEQWVNIAMVYIGSQAAVDMIVSLRK